ncbi:putative Sphingosine N-acyltransferase [Trypanosoma cruzi]|uniref:Putative Sphingosine N-acyltransferase n=1 Tax=Trypanosoma cruzi TaxID=5693 RepID=A0A2V2UNA4_TRYCR|nr:putative Sphingosine N-acyltransferase [Trypanosoma cruzi]
MYAMPLDRAREYGFVSHYNHSGDPAMDRHANNLTFTGEQLWWLVTNPVSLQVHLNGWGGVGPRRRGAATAAAVPAVGPSCSLRSASSSSGGSRGSACSCRVVVPGTSQKKVCAGTGANAIRLNVGQRKKLRKFQTQLWLAVSYTASTVFGYMVQRGEPWFGLPLSEANRISILSPHPYNPGRWILLYYQYGLGFYLSECFSHLANHDIKRSDFLEYVIHHIVTIALIVFSHCSYEHRFGVYVLFIHDASDIMLAVSKALSYVVKAAEGAGAASRAERRKWCCACRAPSMPSLQTCF